MLGGLRILVVDVKDSILTFLHVLDANTGFFQSSKLLSGTGGRAHWTPFSRALSVRSPQIGP